MPDTTAAANSVSQTGILRIRVINQGVVNTLGTLLSGLIGIVMVPFVLHRLGAEQYGIWIAVTSVVVLTGSIDWGLEFSLPREIARACGQNNPELAVQFVNAAGNVYAWFGVISAGIIALLGLPLSRHLHLSSADAAVSRLVFLLAGVCCVANAFVRFSTACLEGLQRFDLANAIAIGQVALRAVGVLVLLSLGMKVIAYAAWYAGAEFLMAGVALAVVASIQPQFRIRFGIPQWPVLRPQLHFTLMSETAYVLGKFVWQVPALIIGTLLGSSFLVPFYLGQKFPNAGSIVNDRMGGVFFPAFSAQTDIASGRELLLAGTRWITAVAVPLCIVLTILDNDILHAWLGYAPPAAVLVLRWFAIVVLLDGLGSCALHYLWGRGELRAIVRVMVVAALLVAGGTLALVSRFGLAAAAGSMLAAFALANAAYLVLACRAAHLSLRTLSRRVFSGLWAAWVCCAIVSAIAHAASSAKDLKWLLAWLVVTGVTYLTALFFIPGCAEENLWMRSAAATIRRFVGTGAGRKGGWQ